VARAPTLQPNGEEDSLPWSSKNAYPGATLELENAYLPWSYPGAGKTPTLELPWSWETAYPGATLELGNRLPWSYPGAGNRLPWSGSRVGPPPSRLGRIPLRLFQLLPFLPQGPRVSQQPPAPGLPWSSPWTLARPPEGAANGRATWAAGLGLVVQFLFSAKTICMGNLPNRLTAARGGRAQGREVIAYPGAPTLEPETDLPYTSSRREGRRNNQPKPNAPENPYASPRGCSPREKPALGKSRRSTAYPQQIVTTRLLYCLQDRFAQLSRLQRI